MNNFHYVSVLLDMIYGIEMEDETMEELGLLAWNLIGNKNARLYRFSGDLDCHNSLTLPCNALDGKIEAVTSSYEDWERTSDKYNFGDRYSAYVENAIEFEKFYPSKFYIPGKLLKYELVNDKLYFPHNYGRVNVLYWGILMDEDGLPELSDKEANAIATYIAYVTKYKEGLITNNNNTLQQAGLIKADWLKLCDQARMTYLNQNDMNNILDIKNSFDRAWYGKSYKPIR